MDKATIETVYTNLLNAMQSRNTAAEVAGRARAELDTLKLCAMRDGLITGKNETERQVCAFQFFEEKYRSLAILEATERLTKYTVEIAQVMVEKERALLRIAELEARTEVIGSGTARIYEVNNDR